ncbi:hypothetical protein BJX76DRAFT_365241 [Aspergillus varians]
MASSSTTLDLSAREILYLFHHVFLPPKLPQEDDYNPDHDSILLDTVICALRDFRAHISSQHGEVIDSILAMVANLKETRGPHGDVDGVKLQAALETLDVDAPVGVLPIHIRSQNAAVLMTKNHHAIHVETFELSPLNGAVNRTLGRLQRQFPGPTLSLDPATFNEPSLRDTIAETLAKMSHQSVPGTKPKVKKARQQHDEDRDTTNPKMVTEFFTAFLRPRSTVIDSLQINKKTREEVLWLSARRPWRRSPLWLLIRVGLQLILRRLCQHEGIPDDIYKHFMVFYMSRVLNVCSNRISDEHRHLMNAKIGRRLLKLDLSYHPAWFAYVQNALERGHDAVLKSWHGIMAQNSSQDDEHSLAGLDFSKDIHCSLPGLDEWLAGIDKREHTQISADFQPQRKLLDLKYTELPSFVDTKDPDYKILNLAAFEIWVEVNLNNWLQMHLTDQDTCQRLGRLINHYYDVASPLYCHNPEAVSVMLLTILELWIACDKSAIKIHPILSGYDCCVPMEVFECVVLPRRSQMKRLARAEKYMHQRQKCLQYPQSCIFQDFGSRSCFSVKYFDQSNEHQNLLAAIEARATQEKNEKRAELYRKHQRYRELIDLADETECTYYEVTFGIHYSFKELRHSPSCKSCAYRADAESISINIHEWPLPRDPLQAKTTVFELMVPRPFMFWRDTTVFFLLAVLHLQYSSLEKPRASTTLPTYGGLSSFFRAVDHSQRIGLLSQDKPHERTHRREKMIIDVTEKDVCLENGLNFHYFDNLAGCFVTTFMPTEKTVIVCTYKLPSSSSSLQRFLYRPASQRNGPPPNTVIASQDVCPQDMSLEEYKALCSMPLGVEIQWENILRQLAMPAVVLKKVETCIFILQIIHQTGPSTKSSLLRMGHAILDDTNFLMALLAEINNAAGRIKENWESAQELSALIFLTQRILSLSTSTQIQDLCLTQLSSLRAISFYWVTLVRDKASSTDSDTRRNDLLSRSTHLALICASTYDSERRFLQIILENEVDASVWIQCCMMIRDRKGLLEEATSGLISILYHRWQILTYPCCPILAYNMVHRKKKFMDIAIREAWAAYGRGSTWSIAPAGCDYWLVARDGNMLVHFNLLTGELLINGCPLSRLPSEYERHETYKTLFGRSPVEVMPSEVPGMQFSGQRKHLSQTIHLGLKPIPGSRHSDLFVRGVSEDQGQVSEFVPPRVLADSFPHAFVHDYAHWYSLDGGYVEFRPVKAPWLPSSSHWRLKRHGKSTWVLVKGEIALVSIRSQTAKSLSNILQPIEMASRLHFKLDTSLSVLDIDIPRLRLSFRLQSRDSSIRSRQYRGMSIDANQSLGTLIGLHNKLILLHENGQDRKVLIPEGNVTWEKDGEHVAIKIGWQEVSNHHAYSVDGQLGCLVDNGSLQSKLILCYLHAVTSFCIPDPLTKKTGTEQALSILHSASTQSFSQLQPENIAILVKIAKLTPGRRYYPENERVMQSVQWQNALGCLVQDDNFRTQVVAILDQHHRMRIFYPDYEINQPELPSMDGDLLRRARVRSSSFRGPGFGAEDHTSTYDCPYSERGRNYQSEECSRVFTLCKTIYEKTPSSSQQMIYQNFLSCLWEFVSQSDKVHGPDALLPTTTIKYDATSLLDPVEFVSAHWCSIHRYLCSATARPNKHRVMIWLSVLAFSQKIPMPVLETLAALYVIPKMATFMPPSRQSFEPTKGYELEENVLRSNIQPAKRQQTPESSLGPQPAERYNAFQSRINSLRNSNGRQALNNFIAALRIQWPTPSPSTPNIQERPRFQDYFDTRRAMVHVHKSFSTWFYNGKLKDYLAKIVSTLSDQPVQLVAMPPCPLPSPAQPSPRKCGFFCMDDVLDQSLGPPPVLEVELPGLSGLLHPNTGSVEPAPRLLALVRALGLQAKSDYERQYVEQLQGSTKSLEVIKQTDEIILDNSELQRAISDYILHCETSSREICRAILSRMAFSSAVTDMVNEERQVYRHTLKVLASVDIGPRFSSSLFLQQLSRQRWGQLSRKWKACFIIYGRSITALQWAKRLLSLIDHREDLVRELQNPGHTNWNPYDFPESLLLEIENGLLIRDVQEQIAQQMREIESGKNAVMQLNMGEGKSSVIVPIVAAALADGTCLVRVLVAKPQSRQMFEMLVSKLGGLLGRRVYHLPVSRSLKMDERAAMEIERICLECMTQGGVLLVQPEHILSLKLMCLECFISGKEGVGNCLLKTLELFRASSRDVVDESDENFSAKFELIYTMGTQRALELSPQRWTLTQQLLDIVRMYAPAVKGALPQSIEVDEHRLGSFPRTRLLHEHAGLELFRMVAEHICTYGIDSLPVSRQPEASRRAILSYILNLELSAQDIAAVEGNHASSFWTTSTKDPILLLRGLLAGGVLASCFGQKRWRVNYGTHESRKPPTKLAVPYRAKDNPAPRSEFSHPDVVVVLTCLSYYYAGLSDDDLFMAFHHLLKSDQADTEYQLWVDDAPGLSRAYHQLGGINLEDRHHCLEHIFPSLRASKGVIDYFLAHIIFPKEMKEFPNKLSSSGWDIGEIKAHPTVGFSGTNDSRITLPLSVEQLDLPEQNHTNALVLEYLLRPENSVIFTPVRNNQLPVSDAQVLLDMVVELDPPTRVILDVGAQILELTNREVAETWLQMIRDDGRSQAVVFVSDSDEICVVDRTGLVEPLQISPFAKQLETCLVFLDEAHTRGIDLKLPQNYRAALVQACMRMRKLGKGQSVVFCIPQEIKAKILAIIGKSDEYDIEVSDVLRWAISETWAEMQRSIPLWAVQGERFERQSSLWRKARSTGEVQMSGTLAEKFLEPESQTIEQRYRPCDNNDRPPIIAPESDENNENIRLILDRCRKFANVNFSATQLQEEQERQLAPEIEQERQVQRPPSANPEKHLLHRDLRLFVSTGMLNRSSQAFIPAFQVLRNTSATKYLNVLEFPSDLLVTGDFSRTVQMPNGPSSTLDDYQRPVNWILTSTMHSLGEKRVVKHMVIISPFEANELHSDVLKSKAVMMHLYAPRQNRSSSPLDNLSLYTIPSTSSAAIDIPTTLRIQLNIFAGQLYISSFDEYREICDFLGLASTTTPEGLTVAADGFILAAADNLQLHSTFTCSPLKFLRFLMSQIRKDGQEIDKTHFGRVLDGKLLCVGDFQDSDD